MSSSSAGNQGDLDNSYAATDATNAASSYSSASGDIGNYLSNVNSTLSAGNPFQSKDYLSKQNLETSGAMHSANTAEKQALGSTVAKTGTNSAAMAGTVASSAREGQRDLTNYNASRDTSNENTWLNQQDKLLGDEATGAGMESSLYSSSLNAEDSALSSATTAKDEQTKEYNAALYGPVFHG
jgi:cytidine deaminase